MLRVGVWLPVGVWGSCRLQVAGQGTPRRAHRGGACGRHGSGLVAGVELSVGEPGGLCSVMLGVCLSIGERSVCCCCLGRCMQSLLHERHRAFDQLQVNACLAMVELRRYAVIMQGRCGVRRCVAWKLSLDLVAWHIAGHGSQCKQLIEDVSCQFWEACS